MIRRAALLTLLSGIAGIAACGERFRVLARAEGRPFLGARRFAVLPVSYSKLAISGMPEGIWLADQNEDERKRLLVGKDELDRGFREELIAGAAPFGVVIARAIAPDPSAFEIAAHVEAIEPGLFKSPFDVTPSVVSMKVRLSSPGGAAIDQVLLESTTQPSIALKSSTGRLQHDGRNLGKEFSDYLRGRV